ncbi:MAG: hypothetical protein SFZ03_00425 [Candidatus Melainabacteria bacterium]|nr:hypothetical protein [Candidatus Melainabacteria bacterium]
MSDAATATTVPASEPAAEEANNKPAETPFNIDRLTSCTARFTRRAWNLFLTYSKEKGWAQIQTERVHFSATAHTVEATQRLREALETLGASEFTQKDKVITFYATFALLQEVIKGPDILLVDRVD